MLHLPSHQKSAHGQVSDSLAPEYVDCQRTVQWGAAQDQLGRDLQRSLPEKSARVQLCRALQTSGFASLEIVNDPQSETSPCLQKGMDLYPENFCRHAQAGSVQSSCIPGVQRPVWRGPCGFSSLAGPLRSLLRDLCIFTHLKTHYSPQLLINADRSYVRFCHLDSGTGKPAGWARTQQGPCM